MLISCGQLVKFFNDEVVIFTKYEPKKNCEIATKKGLNNTKTSKHTKSCL